MRSPRWTHSLRSRIVVSYSLILIVVGVSTSMIGIQVARRALLQQGRQHVVYGLLAAREIYAHRLEELRKDVELLSSGEGLGLALASNDLAEVRAHLAAVRKKHRLDFLSVADLQGECIIRTSGSAVGGDSVTDIAPIVRALGGELVASTELIPHEILRAEDPQLARRATIELIPTPKARPTDRRTLRNGMALVAASPVVDEAGRPMAVIYAGQLLNDCDTDFRTDDAHWIVDEIRATLSPGMEAEGQSRGTVTIFQDDVRITTNVPTTDGQRAVGTRVSQEVYDAVVGEGQPWIGRAFVVNDWYTTAYEPITNLAGERIGMLYVGLLERPYTEIRDQVTLSFVLIGLFCFLLIVVVTYFLTRSLVRPVEEMVSVSQSIAAGDLSRRVRVAEQSELGLLSTSFNDMLDRIEQMKSQLELWARTLEQKVEDRTQQLVTMQTQAARQQRLASVGQLAAGVAHEINNPLGGILTFASLVLEDLPPNSPHREDLEEIVEQAIRCRRIVTELLEFSRGREASMAPADINAVVSRTLALLEKQAIFHDISVTREFDAEMPVTVMDDSQMQQVFMNIILNAVDSMNERGNLHIRTWHDDEEKQVFVRTADTGRGIPPEHREAIFDPFFTTKEPGEGTGLGLAVACRIVEGHGGYTHVESEVGKGTVFTVILPIRDTVPRREDAEKAQPGDEPAV